jgi:uncharacterized protein
MKIVLTGSHGLVGSALLPMLHAQGHNVVRLTHSRPGAAAGPNEVPWNVDTGSIDAIRIESSDAVIHLAGENIAGRWTEQKKRAIRESRVKGTKLLANTLVKLEHKPHTLICASAIGFYGDRGDEVLDESSAPGTGFLAEVCQEWESAAAAAPQAGIRTVFLRIGVVLAAEGGALKKMLMPFKMCVGGVIGSGKQYWSWVALDDLTGVIMHALNNPSVAGAVNVTAPNPATNREFTKALGKVLSRPTIFPMPAFAARLAFGEMGDALLLSSTRALPKRLIENGYEFRFPELEPALRHVLKR